MNFVLSGIIAAFWIIFYALRADLRKKILFSSICSGILGFTQMFFVPSYWDPRFPRITIFVHNLDLDSFVYCFLLGGMASVLYQIVFHLPLFRAKPVHGQVLYIVPPIFFLHLFIPAINVMYFCLASLFSAALLMLAFDMKLVKPMLINGLLLFAWAFVVYVVLWQFPSVAESFNYAALSRITILGIPIEELLFYFAVGTVWSLLYEVLGNGRLRHKLSYFYN